MPDLAEFTIILLTFLLAGFVKGVVGFGLPTVSLGLLAAVTGLHEAMVLLLIPSFVTNLWQALAGGSLIALLRRLWPFLGAAMVTVWIGGLVLTRVDSYLLTALLGVIMIAYALTAMAGLQLSVPHRHERWVGPVAGLVNGVLTGMTGAFVFPGIQYLQALGLSRDALVQTMGMLFLASTVALGLTLQGNGMITYMQVGASATALFPALIGMAGGTKMRRHLSERQFRRVFFICLIVLGGYFCLRAGLL